MGSDVSPPPPDCPHFTPAGWDMLEAGAETVTERAGHSSGRLLAPLDQTSEPIVVHFVDSDSLSLVPPGIECPDHYLDWVVEDSTVVSVMRNDADKWGFLLHGRRDGTTLLRLRPIHRIEGVPHYHYESRQIVIQAGDGGPGFAFTGAALYSGDTEAVRERYGSIRGRVQVDVGRRTGPLSIRWLEANAALVPSDALREGSAFETEIADPAIASVEVDSGDPWTVRILGLTEGSTTLAVRLRRGDGLDYVSPSLPVVVGPAQIDLGIEAVAIRHHCSLVATWNWNPTDLANAATGMIRVRPGESTSGVRLEFLGAWDEQEHIRDPKEASPIEYRLECDVDDPLIATVEPIEDAADWDFHVAGHAPGETHARFRLMRGASVEFESGDIPIRVEADPAPQPDFILKKNGVWTVIWRDGVFGSACTTDPDPGWMEAHVGEITEHYVLRLLDAQCLQIPANEQSQQLEFEFADDCLVRALTYPEHEHAGLSFHLEGIAPGETTLRLRFLDGTVTRFVTPPIPVRILAK